MKHTLTNFHRRSQVLKMRDPANEVVLKSQSLAFLAFSRQLSGKLISAHFTTAINETEIINGLVTWIKCK